MLLVARSKRCLLERFDLCFRRAQIVASANGRDWTSLGCQKQNPTAARGFTEVGLLPTLAAPELAW